MDLNTFMNGCKPLLPNTHSHTHLNLPQPLYYNPQVNKYSVLLQTSLFPASPVYVPHFFSTNISSKKCLAKCSLKKHKASLLSNCCYGSVLDTWNIFLWTHLYSILWDKFALHSNFAVPQLCRNCCFTLRKLDIMVCITWPHVQSYLMHRSNLQQGNGYLSILIHFLQLKSYHLDPICCLKSL